MTLVSIDVPHFVHALRYNRFIVLSLPQSLRLTYRPLRHEDLRAFHRLVTNCHIRQYLMDGEVLSLDWAKNAIRRSHRCFSKYAVGLWLVCEKTQPEKEIAFAGYWSFGDAPLELIVAVRPEYVGRGVATEIVGSLVDFARTNSHLDKIHASVHEPNAASIQVLQKQGFERMKDSPGYHGQILRFCLPFGRVPTILSTPRCTLRPWSERDFDSFTRINADPRVMEFFPAVLSREASDASVRSIQKHFDEHGYGLWALDAPEGLGFMGFIGLSTVEFAADFTPCTEIGWRLATRYWGQGYATEAAIVALRAAFVYLGIEEAFSFTSVLNSRSERVMGKLGMMQAEKKFEHPEIPEGSSLRLHTLCRIDHLTWKLLYNSASCS